MAITITTAIIPSTLGHVNYISSSLIFTLLQVVEKRAILSSWLTGSYCIVSHKSTLLSSTATYLPHWFHRQYGMVITHLLLKDVCTLSKISAEKSCFVVSSLRIY